MAARKVAAFRTTRLSRAGNHQRAGRVSPHTVENSQALLQFRGLGFGLLQMQAENPRFNHLRLQQESAMHCPSRKQFSNCLGT